MNWWIEEYKKYHAEKDTNYPGNNLKPQLHHIKDLVQDTNAKTLLDYGCGTGDFLQYVASQSYKVCGVETNSGGHLTMLRRTKIGRYQVENALTINQICSLIKEN